jgi:hypothetical protein
MSNPIEAALEASSKITLGTAAKVTGMSEEQVAGILADALPKALEAARTDPAAAVEAIRSALESAPESLQQAYEKLASAAGGAGASAEDVVAMFGAQATSLAEGATGVAGATREQVDGVLGAALPAVKDAVRAGLGAADEAVPSIDTSKAQEVLGQAQEAAAAVFGRLAGR